MGLLIKQGKQDVSQDNKFNPIDEKNVTAQITKIAASKTMASTLEVTMQLLNGLHKNRFIIDRVNYDPDSQFSWKYRALRKAANVPYKEDEPVTIDIEALLLNRAVLLDLGIRQGTNKDGEKQDYQNVTYKKLDTTKNVDDYDESITRVDNNEEDTTEDTEEFVDESSWRE